MEKLDVEILKRLARTDEPVYPSRYQIHQSFNQQLC